jgi:hypothetical protein
VISLLPLVVFLFATAPLFPASPSAAGRQRAEQEATSGRVVATVTTLDGTLQLPRVRVELRELPAETVLATTTTDGAGNVAFPDVPPGRYLLSAIRSGFENAESSPFEVRAGSTTNLLLDVRLTFAGPTVDVRSDSASPTSSVQPVSMSDMLDGTVMATAPLQGDDFQSLLPLLPGVVRAPDGRLRIKGGLPTQAALQVSSASLIDPSTGDFDLELPAPSVESVEVLPNPFAAEYGRFSSSVTQIRTRRGTNEWESRLSNLMPRFRSGLNIRGFEPRYSLRGPLKRDRLFFAQDAQFRYLAAPVNSLPSEPDILLKSFDSFTRLDSTLSPRHTLGGALIIFPRSVSRATMNTFRDGQVSPDLFQEGWSAGVQDRFALSPTVLIESTVATRQFEIEVGPETSSPMIYAPQLQSGRFYNRQDRDVISVQWIEALSLPREWHGQHVLKFGVDVQWARFEGDSESRPVEVRRLDGTLAERTAFSGPSTHQTGGNEVALFAQDRWRMGSRVTLEFGLRLDRDAVVERKNVSPRAGVAVAVLPEGRGIIRGGLGKFVQRTPLNIGTFPRFESRSVTRFGRDGLPIGPRVDYANVFDGELRTPEAIVGSIEWNQRVGRRLLMKVGFLQRRGSHEYILDPDPARGELKLSSRGHSRYRELETTARYMSGRRIDVTASYVWARGTADLNGYDQFYGNLRTPLVRANEYSLTPADVRHRVVARATIGLGGQWEFAPVAELRSGFPWSAVNEFQDFVGPRNRAGRLPSVHTLDFQLTRPWRFKKYRFRAGIRAFNAFGASASRDVQTNLTSPDFGRAYNPIERSIGVVFGSSR